MEAFHKHNKDNPEVGQLIENKFFEQEKQYKIKYLTELGLTNDKGGFITIHVNCTDRLKVITVDLISFLNKYYRKSF